VEPAKMYLIYCMCVLCIELVISIDSLLKISHFVDIFVSFQLIWHKKVRFCNQFVSIFMCVSVWKLLIFLSYSSKTHTASMM